MLLPQWRTARVRRVAAFPSVAVGSDGADADEGDAADTQARSGCPGRLGRMNKTDLAHNRVPGVCKRPYVDPVVF